MINTIPCTDRRLQAFVQYVLDQLMVKQHVQPFECLRAEANDQGEVWLHGFVEDPTLAENAIAIAEDVPGVHCVFNNIVVAYRGVAMAL